MKIQTYLIHGSLGAGKTTILNSILSDPNFNKAVVIENEFANFNVDEYLITEKKKRNHKTHSIVGGCICCSSGTELFDVLEEISKNKKIKKVLIETTGVANSIDLIKQLILSSTFDDSFELNKNILVVDSFEENIDKYIKDKALDIKIADIVFLTKTDISTKGKVKKFNRLLKEVGNENIVSVVKGKFDATILLDNNKSESTNKILDNIDLFSLPPNSHVNSSYYQVIKLKKEIDRSVLIKIINTINLEKEVKIKRLKGFITENGDEYIVNGTKNSINFTKLEFKLKKPTLVLIGNKITRSIVNKYFNEYV